MNNELKPYDEYKNSEVDWIGNIPSHWKVVRNSILFREIVDTNHPQLELLSIMCDKGIVKQSSTGRKIRMSEENQTYKKICVGDIGYNLMNAFMGGIGASKYEGIISPAYAVCRPKVKLNSRYYHYLFRTPLYKAEFNKNSYGIMYERNRLYFDRFKRISTFVPPLDEQDQIVKYLDFQLIKINKFIKVKKKLILALKEQKQAVINEAVTKGINPNVKVKPSGIQWLEDIPEHWAEIRVKELFYVLNGATPKSGKEEYWDGNIAWITPADLSNVDMYIISSERKITELGFESCSTKLIPSGNIVLATRAPIGNIRINSIPLCTNQGCKGLISKKDINIKYFYFALSSFEKELQNLGDGTTFAELSTTKLCRFKLLIPPKEEQDEILDYIEKKTNFIDKSIKIIQKEIDLITEYRTSLISNVVTGKVDVRHIEIDDIIEEDTDIDETEDEIIESEEDINIGESGE